MLIRPGIYILKTWNRYLCSCAKSFDLVVTSLRIDRIIATGLGIGRRQSEYSLLSGLIKLNGETVTKKSKEVIVGDIIDRILPES